MPKIERLAWDSEFFGYETGKLELEKEKDFDPKSFLENATPFRLVYLFSPRKLQFEKLGLFGEKVVFSQLIRGQIAKKIDFLLQSFNPDKHTSRELEKLALESGKYSRFKTDAHFNNHEFQQLYKKWIENSLNGNIAFDTIVAENNFAGNCTGELHRSQKASKHKEKNILGFVTLSKKNESTAKIGLIAVDKKARNLGVASALIAKGLSRSKEKGFDELEVATQGNNLPAMALYKKNGFGIKERFFVYHFWK